MNVLRRLGARLHRLLHPPRANEIEVRERMGQYVGVEVPTAPYKIERRHVHGELYTYKIRLDHTDPKNPN